MKVSRRIFTSSLGLLIAAVGGGGVWLAASRGSARIDTLVIDPVGEEFIYRDGWIVRS